ncbi:hypothetical protein CTZ28_16525 [Streptomyces shenzhenensis]|uniref:Uncharacterized protein n=1 Tax=Streptomyces shenzhenensis TaxID=943815 RepID=A0A3M0ID98_9ACTN|nr:hypothetical protein CTZ28_16525 [Streptomyces shenzhenensis]
MESTRRRWHGQGHAAYPQATQPAAEPDPSIPATSGYRVSLAPEPLAVLFGSSRTVTHRTLLKIRTRCWHPGIDTPQGHR